MEFLSGNWSNHQKHQGMVSRRKFLQNGAGVGLLGLTPVVAAAEKLVPAEHREQQGAGLTVPIDGYWDFCLDGENKGISQEWFAAPDKAGAWRKVEVPHTWQIEPEHTDYFGAAWYKKDLYVPGEWQGKTIRIEFEAVYHSARVWLNGKAVGTHLRKGYTAFLLDLTPAVQPGRVNTLVVRADNTFDEDMLPRGHSYDWAADGGITRPVSLHVTAPTFAERVAVTTDIDIDNRKTTVSPAAVLANKGKRAVSLEVSYRVREEKSAVVAASVEGRQVKLKAGETREVELPASVVNDPLLWHFDHPHLYVLELELWKDGRLVHSLSATFGIRKIEVRKDAGFYLNGERVWLMGVERMGGSNPEYGMAEPSSWITHDHKDLKILNCVFTRAHWQQDKRVLDYCDRHGIFIQSEVPTWGYATFNGMKTHPSKEIMQNGLEQLQEMIHRDRNHPSIFSWGLCNEIHGQNPPAYEFAERMLHEAKRMDPGRLCSYASNSLQEAPGKDVSRLMDFVEWNEYYGSWYKGTVEDMENNLEEIHKSFPDKPIVISEYGWCRCTPDRKVGDPKKIEVLRSNDEVFRKHDYVAGLIFFCYNDYRTHIGDKGLGALKQRVHGVVDLFGARKPSFDVLRYESGPVEMLNSWMDEGQLHIRLQTREKIPAYVLRDYILRWTVYADQNIPVEQGDVQMPDLRPGTRFSHIHRLATSRPEKIAVEIVRPTGFSVMSKTIHEQ